MFRIVITRGTTGQVTGYFRADDPRNEFTTDKRRADAYDSCSSALVALKKIRTARPRQAALILIESDDDGST